MYLFTQMLIQQTLVVIMVQWKGVENSPNLYYDLLPFTGETRAPPFVLFLYTTDFC